MVGEAGNLMVHKVRSNPEELVKDLDLLIGLQGESFYEYKHLRPTAGFSTGT